MRLQSYLSRWGSIDSEEVVTESVTVRAYAINMTHDIERDRGGLTKDDRRHLLGYSNLEGSSRRRVRARIRDRVHNVFLDFPILVDNLDAQLRKTSFIGNSRDDKPPTEAHEAMANAVAFIYLCYTDHTQEELSHKSFGEIAMEGVGLGVDARGEEVMDFDLLLKTTSKDTTEIPQKYRIEDGHPLIQKMQRAEDLTSSEIKRLVMSGHLDGDELFSPTPYTESDRDEILAEDAATDRGRR